MGGLSVDLFTAHDCMVVRAELVRTLGGDASAALVLTRIRWRCQGPESDDGWWTGSQDVLAEETGLSSDQVHRTITRLKNAGYLAAKKRHVAGTWDHTFSYRPIICENDVAESRQEEIADPRFLPSLLETLGDVPPPESPSVEEAERLCHLFADQIAGRGNKRPAVTKAWIADMEKMIRLDGREPRRIEACLNWLNAGRDRTALFWQGNVRCPAKLRERFDHLSEQHRNDLKARNGNGHVSDKPVITAAYGARDGVQRMPNGHYMGPMGEEEGDDE